MNDNDVNELFRLDTDNAGSLWLWCPGCDDLHRITTNGPNAWMWDSTTLSVSPSILVRGGSKSLVCHSFLRNGRWEFLADSTHEFAGQTVDMYPMPPLPEGGEQHG